MTGSAHPDGASRPLRVEIRLAYDGYRMLDPAAGLLLVGCLSLLFASASLHKLRDLRHFTGVLRPYRELPGGALLLEPLFQTAHLTAASGLFPGPIRLYAGFGGGALL